MKIEAAGAGRDSAEQAFLQCLALAQDVLLYPLGLRVQHSAGGVNVGCIKPSGVEDVDDDVGAQGVLDRIVRIRLPVERVVESGRHQHQKALPRHGRHAPHSVLESRQRDLGLVLPSAQYALRLRHRNRSRVHVQPVVQAEHHLGGRRGDSLWVIPVDHQIGLVQADVGTLLKAGTRQGARHEACQAIAQLAQVVGEIHRTLPGSREDGGAVGGLQIPVHVALGGLANP